MSVEDYKPSPFTLGFAFTLCALALSAALAWMYYVAYHHGQSEVQCVER